MDDSERAALTPERWRRAAPIVEAVLDLPVPERDAYLEQWCSDQPELRADVLQLLKHSLTSGDLLDAPAAERFSALLPESQAMLPNIGERYVLGEALGAGGAAVVYRAHDPTTRRDVAVKVLHEHLASESGRQRFLREVRIAANLSHSHIVPVFDAGQVDSHVFYVMPLVSGGSLRRRLETRGRLSSDAIRRVLQEVASALAFAHAQGLVHRDIKPDNVLLADDDRAMVADFGIAKALSASTPVQPERVHTVTGFAIGTPAYMAPEQVLGDATVDASADLYAFGAMGYELLTGHPPFTGRSGQEIAARHLSDTPVPLLAISPGVDPVLADVVMRCLSKARHDRPTAAEVVDAITHRTPLPVLATPAGTPTPTPAHTPSLSAPSTSVVAPWRIAAFLGVCLAVVVIVVGLTRRSSPSASDATAPVVPRTPVVLADFDAPAGDSVLATMFADAVRVAMAHAPLLEVLSDRRVSSALYRMGTAPGTRLAVPIARELAQREGIGAVISGSIIGNSANGYQLTVRAVTVDSGRVLAQSQAALHDPSTLIGVADSLVRQIRIALGERQESVSGATPLPRVTTTSFEALRKYSQAREILQRGERSPRTVQLLQDAIALDSNFAMAYVLLVRAHGGEVARTIAGPALTQAYRRRDLLPTAEAAFIAAQYFDVGIGADPEIAERYYRQAMAYGDTGSVRSALAEMRMHAADYAGAIQLLLTSEVRDSLDADETATLIAALAMQERDAEAEGRLTQATRAGMLSQHLLALQPTLPWFRGDYAAAERIAQTQIDQTNPAVRYMGLMSGNAIAVARGKLARADSLAVALAGMQGSPVDGLEHAANDAIIVARLLGNPDSAFALVESAKRRHPLDQLPELARPYYPLVLAYAFTKRPLLAGAMVDSLEHLRDTAVRRAMAPSMPPLRALVAIAAGTPDSALALLRRTQRRSGGLEQYRLDAIAGDAHFAAARFDSAAVYYERYRRARNADKMYGTSDPVWLSLVLYRLGECYETLADRPRATAAYQQLLRLWEGADPAIAARAADIRMRVDRLRASPMR